MRISRVTHSRVMPRLWCSPNCRVILGATETLSRGFGFRFVVLDAFRAFSEFLIQRYVARGLRPPRGVDRVATEWHWEG